MEDSHSSRREFLVSATAALLAVRPLHRQRGALTAQQIADRVRSAIGVEWRAQSADGFKAGDPGTVVTGIATTVMATTDVLRRAAASGQNFIVTQEPLFYMPNEEPGNRAKDPVYLAKKALIDERRLVVFRLSEHWNARQPNEPVKALAAALKWTSEVPRCRTDVPDSRHDARGIGRADSQPSSNSWGIADGRSALTPCADRLSSRQARRRWRWLSPTCNGRT